MPCPDCGERDRVTFAVPDDLREYAPGNATVATICPACLRTHAANGRDPASGDGPAFDRIATGFPSGAAGAAVALALGRCGSLALHRESIVTLLEYAETEGVDVLLTFDRVATESGGAHFDVGRRARQIGEFL